MIRIYKHFMLTIVTTKNPSLQETEASDQEPSAAHHLPSRAEPARGLGPRAACHIAHALKPGMHVTCIRRYVYRCVIHM